MKLTGIISISGKSGLSKIISQTRTGLIIESIIDGKRTPIHGAERVSSLEDISIYTYDDDILLSEVFDKMYENANGEKVISHKSSANELKNYIKEILPNYDEERVYVSDLKKLVQWYNLLHDKDLLIKDEESSSEEEKEGTENTKKTTKSSSSSSAKPKQTKVKAQKPNTKAASKQKSTQGAAKGR